ncbi:MAG: hypothetical protein OEX18_06285 [Candidatus Krumholzibacteria bacterium]|nr:hypothetical protein [Candidatus Krumholzibacteria bacterium]MDH4336872.1 hypothetical protein [Candidatus Krumholzibacteria bacterium]MDH5269203.1 hypothetical protein [Candidatus Krumholzibacteria bacterium]MDH5626953.1 hypothetical protein [Candidatus Krumholzibacteria bacterium]
MNPPRLALIILFAGASLLSCSSDPVAPGGPGTATGAYDIRLESFGERVSSVWGRSANDVYAGADMLLHFDGRRWTPTPLPREMSGYTEVWGTASGELLLPGYDRIYRSSGGTWDYVAMPFYARAVCGLPSGEILVAADEGYVYRYDGATWSEDSVTTGVYFRDIHATSTTNVFAVGEPDFYSSTGPSTIAQYDGNEWHCASIDSMRSFYSVLGLQDGSAFVLGSDYNWETGLFRYVNGLPLAPVVPGGDRFIPATLWGTGADVYVGGRDDVGAVVYHNDGASWVPQRIAASSQPGSGWTAPTGEVFTTHSRNGLYKTDAAASERILGGGIENISTMWASPEGDIFVAGVSAYRFDGENWIDLDKESITSNWVYGIDGTSNRDLYAVGSGMILHYDGAVWDWVSGAFQESLRDVAVAGVRVFAVGDYGGIVQFDGRAWERTEIPGARMIAVDAWEGGAIAVGVEGGITRHDGTAWRLEESPVSWWLFDVVAFGPHDIIAVGENAWEIVVYDGRTWMTRPIESYRATGRGNPSEAIWGRSSRDFYVAQYAGTIQRFAGGSWSELPHVISQGVSGVAGTPNGDVFVSGSDKIISYRRR